MSDLHPHIQNLISCTDLEEREEVFRFRLDKEHSLKSLKSEGLAIHPIQVTRKTFGYADYPEVSFKIAFSNTNHLFRDGASIECFLLGEEPIKGVLIQFNGRSGEFRLLAPDFPDWLEEHGVGIKLAPDQRTTFLMKKALKAIPENPYLLQLFNQMQGVAPFLIQEAKENLKITLFNQHLNNSQKDAVLAIIENNSMCIVHGPPGTGKTTTLIEAIRQLVLKGEKIIVAAPSNTAVDHLCAGLLSHKLNILRVGNTNKVNSLLYDSTPEGKADGKQKKEIKDLKIRAEEFRRMALKYKRSFGKAEREQRSLLFAEVKKIRNEIKKLISYYEDKLYQDAQVILGTPIGLSDSRVMNCEFNTLFIDEAGQCLEPLAWCIFPFAQKIVLAGDHLQLPPTILSDEARRKGLNVSILEQCFKHITNIQLLDTQYRMRESIAGFSSFYFYESQLKTPPNLNNVATHISFIDTAGSGFEEERGQDGNSLMNKGEIDLVLKIIESEQLSASKVAFISPYSGQVELAKERLQGLSRISTIDSFQGQEMEVVILSLVRSNEASQIGFLSDYRRMNVALTRAKEQLFVIGDSATLGSHAFYKSFLEYIERAGVYRSCWEWME